MLYNNSYLILEIAGLSIVFCNIYNVAILWRQKRNVCVGGTEESTLSDDFDMI